MSRGVEGQVLQKQLREVVLEKDRLTYNASK